MNPQQIWEIIGYIGSLLVLISLLMSSVIKLRVINTIGSFIFCVYALAIHSIPTALMNGALVFINLYYLIKLLRTKKSFTVVETTAEDASVLHFLSENQKDIEKYFPFYQMDSQEKVFLTFHGLTLAGVFLARQDKDSLIIELEYSSPSYRDCSVGANVYRKLKDLGYGRLIYKGNNAAHVSYVKKMGFLPQNDSFVKTL